MNIYFCCLKFHLLPFHVIKKKHSQDHMKDTIQGCIISRILQLTLWRMCLQIDGRLCAKSESYGSSGCVFPTVQLLSLRGGSEEPTSADVVRRSHGPGHHAWSWQHH